MNKEIAKKWVKALRSGKYKQGQKSLCTVKGKTAKYCCLGVLCHILKTPYEKCGDLKRYDEDTAVLPSSVLEKAGMHSCWGETRSGHFSSLTHLNDDGKSFNEIADFIEQHAEEL